MGKYQAHRDFTICVSFTRFQPDGFQFPILPVNFLFVLVIALKTVQTPPAAQSVSTSTISRSSVLALDSSSVPVNSGGDKEGFIQPPPHCNLWSRNYRIKIYPIQGQVSWRVSPASEKQFQDHLMNFLKLSPLTTQPAELSSSHWGPLGQSKYELFIGPSEQSKCQCQNGGQYQSLDILNPMAKSHDFPFIGFHSNSNSDILPIKELQLPGDPKIRTPDGQF